MRIRKVIVCLSMAAVMCAGRLLGQDVSTASRADIEKIVREYILQHPEVLMESARIFQERERLEAQRRSKGAVVANRRDLFDDAASPVTGATSPEVAIVQFFDYKCGYCRRVLFTLSTLLERHSNVRLIFKELPILGAESQLASTAALAADKQGAYMAFHRELMTWNGPLTQAAIDQTARKLGLDVARLRADMVSKEVEGALLRNQQLAKAIGVRSTPSFVIGEELISGAMDLARFEELIAASRNRPELSTKK
jgi:protein-disulfide isomerase